MHILFLGYSNLLKKRILPILHHLPQIERISIAKFRDQIWDSSYSILRNQPVLYDNFQEALQACEADIVYISTVNSAHFEWAEKFLDAGYHVIVDKPATLFFRETERLISLAKKQKRLLVESTVYLYHPQFSMIRDLLKTEGIEPKFLNLSFSFPPLDPSNFRYREELGGGAVYDTGVYALSPGRYFFGSEPEEVFCTTNSFSDGLLVSYSILARYSRGRSLIGHFGFTTEYINRMNILGDQICLDIDRVFTLPDNIENEIKFRIRNSSGSMTAPKSNMFLCFFNKVFEALEKKTFEEFYSHMLTDSKSMQKIINSVNNYKNGN